MENNVSFQSTLSNFQPIFNSINFFQITSSLSQIILLILILAWILKKISFFKIKNIISRMKVVDRLSIGTHESIVVIKVEEVKLILGVTTNNITHLYTLPSIVKDKSINDKDKKLLQKTL